MRIELGTRRKYRGKSEWRNIQTATYGGMEEAGDHSIIVSLCKRMAAEGLDGDVEVWRDGELIFAPHPLSRWASGKALRGEQPEHLRKRA
jgi:hypothetical protein